MYVEVYPLSDCVSAKLVFTFPILIATLTMNGVIHRMQVSYQRGSKIPLLCSRWVLGWHSGRQAQVRVHKVGTNLVMWMVNGGSGGIWRRLKITFPLPASLYLVSVTLLLFFFSFTRFGMSLIIARISGCIADDNGWYYCPLHNLSKVNNLFQSSKEMVNNSSARLYQLFQLLVAYHLISIPFSLTLSLWALLFFSLCIMYFSIILKACLLFHLSLVPFFSLLQHSLCSQELRELSNPGASGSIFYITADDEFIIKTVQHKEANFLQKLLPEYYMNLVQHTRTLLPKFYGLHCYQVYQRVSFIVKLIRWF